MSDSYSAYKDDCVDYETLCKLLGVVQREEDVDYEHLSELSSDSKVVYKDGYYQLRQREQIEFKETKGIDVVLNSEQTQSIINDTRGKVYFTSDTHVNSERTLELSKRPFDSVEEMDETLLLNLCSLKQDDLLIHLGDVGTLDFTLLRCKVLLLKGNYERTDKEIFKEVQEIATGVEVVLNENTYRLTHEPNERNLTRLPNVESNPFYLFGHIHKLQMVKRNGLNVGVDCHNFRPIDVETIEFYRTAIEKFYDENVFSEKCDA